MKRPVYIIAAIAATVILLSAQAFRSIPKPLAMVALDHMKQHTSLFIQGTFTLEEKIKALDIRKPETMLAARQALRASRYRYKGIEYFMEYFFKSSAHIYNAPAKIEVEEPELEYEEPVGFQVMESLLYQRLTPQVKLQLLQQANAVCTSAQDIPSLFYQFKATDEQVTESVRQELIRIETLNITGYDAPLLKSGINESVAALAGIDIILTQRHDANIDLLIRSGVAYLKTHPGFDHFDRLHFITTCITPLQKKLGISLFDRNFLKVDSFYKQGIRTNPAMVALGKRLFFEKAISGNGQRSCAGCHQPEKYFTDGLPKSATLDGHGTIPRNAPTLFYAAYQYRQDWDGKAGSIEDQVINVMHNKDEMNADSATVLYQLKRSSIYPFLFGKAFTGQPTVTISHLSSAIAVYLRTLAPFNSAFDRYMNGGQNAMTQEQIHGFNLFMGKAQCGTCHFAPLFNGLTPPGYQATEYEVLGTPLTDDLKHPRIDPDLGRFVEYPSKYYKAAFKTPTVRNITRTAPYMHNGSFHSLQKVVDFYNKGGGQGIGLNIPNQTLSADQLHLSPKEVKDLIAFLHALTDRS